MACRAQIVPTLQGSNCLRHSTGGMESGQQHQILKPENRQSGNENPQSIGSVVYSLVGKTPEPLPVGKENFLLNR